ncbi:hypothetical protein DPMN_102651 [Dreissena polymorpha]|uniref:Reverse transcriptase domain-containing protein n=1 Tax=Dreissena polymorpha TaxID=45954 RepID=A0A9D4RB30_DREPO|nr:hypothetical protein DPMN_102651 [Dreissena polymorpha]
MGVKINGKIISHLFYADDLVLIAENEEDLQHLLTLLSKWCDINNMKINTDKSKIMHFRPPSKQKTNFNFKCNDDVMECVESYRYLGLMLTDTLDYNVTAKHVAQSATRALGLIIAKFKALGGMPYEVFSKLYEACVWPTISYGAAIWGTREFSCINAVQHRAARFFLGVGKYTPNAAVNGDIGWTPPIVKQWKAFITHWIRLSNMDTNRLNNLMFRAISYHNKC